MSYVCGTCKLFYKDEKGAIKHQREKKHTGQITFDSSIPARDGHWKKQEGAIVKVKEEGSNNNHREVITTSSRNHRGVSTSSSSMAKQEAIEPMVTRKRLADGLDKLLPKVEVKVPRLELKGGGRRLELKGGGNKGKIT
jgi:hypothetical protein